MNFEKLNDFWENKRQLKYVSRTMLALSVLGLSFGMKISNSLDNISSQKTTLEHTQQSHEYLAPKITQQLSQEYATDSSEEILLFSTVGLLVVCGAMTRQRRLALEYAEQENF